MLCGVYTEALTRRCVPATDQCSAPVSPSQCPRQLRHERPQLPGYELAVQQLNERRRQTAAVVQQSRVYSLDSVPAEPE